MKWIPEEREKAFDEYRKNAGIIPHKKHVAKANAGVEIPPTDTRNQVAYVPKPTQTPSAPQRNDNDSGDTHMTEGTEEEEKKSIQQDRASEHVAKNAKRVNREGKEDN